jgi:iron complex outermembrane receptor protein
VKINRISVLCAAVCSLAAISVPAQEAGNEALDFLFEDSAEAPQKADSAITSSSQDPADGMSQSSDGVAESADTPSENANAPATEPETLDTIAVDEQVMPADRVKRPSSNRLLEEIVVTAQKREESVQDIPISVSAFSAGMLDAKGIFKSSDLPKTTPGLTITPISGYSVTYLRGVGTDAFFMADPSVVLYIDGIYFPFSHGLAQDMEVVERVEVLKGPQGTLFGRNAVGGAINVITKDPPLDEMHGSISSSLGTYDSIKNRAFLGIPISDSLSVSFAGVYNNEGPFLNGTTAGHKLPNEVAKGGRLKLMWRPLDNLEFLVAGLHVENDGAIAMFSTNADPSALFRPVIQPQPRGGDINEDVYFHLKSDVLYGSATLQTSAFDVKVLASDQKIKTSSAYDMDGSMLPLAAFDAPNQFAKVKTGELQVLSNDSSWGNDWLEWIVGGYYFESTQGFDPLYLRAATTDLEDGLLLGIQIPDVLQGVVNGLLNSALPIPTGTVSLSGIVYNESLSGFAQTTVRLTDWFSVTTGFRYQEEERTLLKSDSFLTGTGVYIQSYGTQANPLAPIGGDAPGGNSRVTKSFKPKVSLEFRPQAAWLGDEPLIYLSWQQAVKSAAVNALNIYDPPDFVKPEELEAYEAGIKSSYFDRTVTFSAAVFSYIQKNPQVQFISLLQGGVATFENAGGARIDGFDFDATILAFPQLIDGLVFTFGGAVLDGRYTNYKNASGFNPTTRVLYRNYDFSGNQITRTPDFTGTAGVVKTFDLDGSSIEVGADVYYNSGYYHLAQNEPFTAEDAYTLVSARVSYAIDRFGLRLTVFGDNITNEDYNFSRFPNDFGTLDQKAPLALYGLRVNWEF